MSAQDILVEMMKTLTQEVLNITNAQREQFLSQHLDKVGTHEIAYFPWEMIEGQDGKTLNTQLILLVPKGTNNCGTREEAVLKYPHTILSYSIRYK